MQHNNTTFKQTDIGRIPEHWDVKTLGEIAEIKTGNTPPTNDRSNYGDEFLFVSPADLGKSKWILKSEKNLSIKGFSVSRQFPANSILYTCIGSTIGKSGIAKNLLTSNQQINAILPNNEYSSEYLYYALDIISNKIKSRAGEQAVPLINKSEFCTIQIPLPPLAEQTRIAAILSDADALIASLQALHAKQRDLKQATMQELLKPKAGWEVKRLGDVAEIVRGQMVTINTISNGTIPVIAGGMKPAYYHNKANRFGKTITISGSGASAGYISFHQNPIFASDCSTISEDKRYSIDYLYYFLQLQQDKIYKMQTGGAQPHIGPKDLKPLKIPFPPLAEQMRIAAILSDIDDSLAALSAKIAKYQGIKQGMMQGLLTGRCSAVL
jgi:type I restriction enzyme, S subunit